MNAQRLLVAMTVMLFAVWGGEIARGQCTPYVPPSTCGAAPPLACPDGVNGDFCNGEPWYLGPGGLLGVLPSGNELRIDRTCDGDVNDPADEVFNVPPTITNALQTCLGCFVEYRLSPSQDVLYARVATNSIAVSGCAPGQSRIYFFAIESEPDLIAFSGIHQGACMNTPAIPPMFYDKPGDLIRTAVIVGAQGLNGVQPVYWADLVNRQVNIDAGRYRSSLQLPQFSQRGNALFLPRISGGFATGYALVDLCRSPIAAGDAVTFGDFALGTTGVSAEVSGTTGNRQAIITRSGSAPIAVSLDDCLCGACCDGGCTDDMAATACSGSFFGDTTCTADPCAGPPDEACCFPTGTCQDEPPADCPSLGGTPLGAGSDCLTALCPPDLEACCVAATGQCLDMPPDDCTANGDSPGGPGSDCSVPACPPPAGSQACCIPSGACLNLPPVGPFPSCTTFAGIPQAAGTNCLNGNVACPFALLTITKSAPTSVTEGSTFTYTITYGNAGPNDATGVEVRETVPTGASFVSAGNTPGGTAPTVLGGALTWPVGTLAAGVVGQQVTVTVRANCGITQIVNNNYRISGTPGGIVMGAILTTPVVPTAADPVPVTVQSVDLTGPPLKEGDLLEHTISLTNTTGGSRPGISVRGRFGGNFRTGGTSLFDSVVNSAGGIFNVDFSNTSLHWIGDLPASATVNIVFRTRIPFCAPVGSDDEVLNRGDAMSVRDGCNRELGLATPGDRFTVQRKVTGRTFASNLYAPKGGAGFFFDASQVARVGSAIQFETHLTTDELTDVPNVTVHQTIPPELMVNNPPFVGPIPPGATYDSAARRIDFTGTVPANGEVLIAWEGTLDPNAPCRVSFALYGETAECAGGNANIGQDLNVFLVPELPTDRYLVTMDAFRGLSLMVPGVDDRTYDLLCKHGEIYTALARTADGELWVSGLPSLRFDPVNLECELFLDDFFAGTLGMLAGPHPDGVCYDRFTDTVIFTGDGAAGGRVVRYDPATRTGTLILEDPTLAGGCIVDQEGHVAVQGNEAIVRIDPANPAAYQSFPYATVPTPPGVPPSAFVDISDMALDVDGNYLLMIESFWISGPNVFIQNWVGKVDRNTGLYSIVVDNLQALHPFIRSRDMVPALAASPDGSLYFSQRIYPDPIYRTERSCANLTSYLGIGGETRGDFVEFVTIYDMQYSDPVVDIGPVPTVLRGDIDGDCTIGLVELTALVDCMEGPTVLPSPTPPMTVQVCLDVFDFDGDGDVDLDDTAEFARRLTG